MKRAMGTIECYVCENRWEQKDSNGKDFCTVVCFKKIYTNRADMPELYDAKIKSIKRRNKENGLKF